MTNQTTGIKQNINSLNQNIKRKVKTFIPLQLIYVIGVYFLCLFFMMMNRVLIFFVHCVSTLSDFNFGMLIRSLLYGIRFDSTIVCGLLAPFLLFMFIFSITNINKRWLHRSLHIILVFCCCFLFLIGFLDAAYFTYFQSHINVIVLSCMRTPKYLFEIILHSPAYLIYILAFLGELAWFSWLMFCLYNSTLFKTIPPYSAKQPTGKILIVGSVIFVLFFFGIRGRITDDKPLTISKAYYSDNDFFNQLGVSPMFSLVKSYQEEKAYNKSNNPYIDPLKGRQIVMQEFANRDDVTFAMPTLKEGTNILMLIMEDVTAKNVTRKEMPTLYDIANSSLSFNNVYADGEYVHNGLYSILFAYPNIFSENSMTSAVIPKMQGLPSLIKQLGYKTYFFTSKRQSTDNTTRFLLANETDSIYSGKANDLKRDGKVLSKSNSPFFACVLVSYDKSANGHKSTDKKLSQILQEAKKYSWYDNTLVIFVGANGYGKKIPLYFYNKKIFPPQQNNTLACQTDITPTLMTMLDSSYRNETMGINIYSQRRSFAYTANKDEISVFANNAKYVWNKNKTDRLDTFVQDSVVKTNNNDSVFAPFLSQQELSQKMREYVFAMYQIARYNIAQMKMKKE